MGNTFENCVTKRTHVVYLWLLLSLLVGCGQQSSSNAPDIHSVAAPAKMVADAMPTGAEQSLTEFSEPKTQTTNPSAKKYIAMRHNLTVETAPEKMQANFDATLKQCEALNCQILSATYNKESSYSPPSASLSLRIPPRNVSVFLSGLAKHGEIMQHTREAEDKTNQVVDTDARLQNLTHLRDRLRDMLNDKRAGYKDIIEVERELASTQSQLDSMQSIRKLLALETDLVAVNINFNATQGITEQGFFAPVAYAIKDAGRVMMESLASVITFVVGIIPWLLIGIPIIWLARKYWLKIKSKWV